MKIIHTSDWHLGRTLHGADLSQAQALFIESLVGQARREAVDAVLISGDVYDRALPSAGAVDLLEDALVRLTSFTKVIVTPGNHDSAKRLGFGSQFYRPELVVVSKLEQVGQGLSVGDGLVYPLPYLEPLVASRFFDTQPSHQAVMEAALARVHADLARRRQFAPQIPAVLMAHAFVSGGVTSESERDISIGGMQIVSADTFGSELSYVALGHLHRSQQISAQIPMYYSGSPVPYSFSEAAVAKSSLLVTCTESGTRVEKLPVPQLRPISVLRGTLEELLGGNFEKERESWVRAEVTDTCRPPHLHQRLLAYFPHLLSVEFFGSAHLAKLPSRSRIERQGAEVTIDFAKQVGRRELSESGKKLVHELWYQLEKGDEHAAS